MSCHNGRVIGDPTNDFMRRDEQTDAARWDARYTSAPIPQLIAPPELVTHALADISTLAPVLDVACGWGDAGLWLADNHDES